MDNLERIIDIIEQEIDEKNAVKEKVLQYSRTIIINCRKAIQRMHQNQFEQASSLIKETSHLIIKIHKETD